MESAYRNSLCHELKREKHHVEMEKYLPLVYAGVRTKKAYRIDLLIENRVVVEVKALTAITPVMFAQMQTYLTLSNCNVGLILNFNVRYLKDGIKRIINPSRL